MVGGRVVDTHGRVPNCECACWDVWADGRRHGVHRRGSEGEWMVDGKGRGRLWTDV